MSGFTGEAGAALVFLIGYLFIFLWMLFAYLTHRIKWRSRYTLLFFHVTIRVASQACGIAFGVLGFKNTDVFLAYLILGAEGYFSLVLCTFRFIISWHQHNLASGESWLEPRDRGGNKTRKFLLFVVLGPLAFLFYRDNPMVFLHCVLILANTAIIVGGSYLAGNNSSRSAAETNQRLRVSKITRTAGQGVFLACNALLLGIILATMRNNRREGDARRKPGTVHPTLVLLLLAWFPLIVRGTFAILQASVYSLSYYNPENYTATGFTPEFTVIEYVLGVLTEWLACVLLNLTYLTSRNDPKKVDIREKHETPVSREPPETG
ncbi:hypothetical protein B0H15DRAFT_799702 [Mycena belliarum]|uniref:Uncharacterized protein n=1 Tax=Mycena belliarum TaxID=1033014 RepID=A0AAD6UB48_9AGAR|nr:hypothetical protein B0H15DRAFT_799702 [Mycena belliae]